MNVLYFLEEVQLRLPPTPEGWQND